MIKDRVLFDLPAYDGLLAGHYSRGPGYSRRRVGGTDDWLLIMTLQGEGRFGSSVGDLRAKPYSMYLIAPGITHDYGTTRGTDLWEILWVHFQPPMDWLDLLSWPLAAPGIHLFDPADRDAITEAFREVYRLSLGSNRLRTRLAMNALEKLLLLCDAQSPPVPLAVDERIGKVVEFISSHLSDSLSARDLAQVSGLSESRFAHLFRASIGMPPKQFVLLQRLQRGHTLLERTSLSVAEVAASVGMDPFNFSLKYKSWKGVSPREVRRPRVGKSSVGASPMIPCAGL